MREFKTTSRYSNSDKLAFVLACLAGIMAIILTLVDKTPLTVSSLLGLIVILSIYPIWHCFKSKIARTLSVLVVIAVTILFGWNVWPRNVDASSQDKKQEPPVQQTNQGNGNTNINGNGNTVINKPTTIISRNDPQAKELIKKLDKVLKSQEELTPEKLLLRYPLGYVIFDANYQNAVFPYQTRGEVDKWHVNWSRFKYVMTDDSVYFQMPDFTYTADGRNGVAFWNNTIKCKKVVGSLCGGAFFAMEKVQMSGDILAVRPDGVVFLFGFKNISPP